MLNTPGKYKYFAVGAIGTFMATLDGSIVNVALPTLSRELSATVDQVAWVVLSYSLTLISLMLIFGAWVDRRGYLFGYQFGFIFFLLGSILCSVAGTVEVLVLGRIVQAVGTAMFAAIGPGLVTTVFPPHQRGKGIGLMIMMVAAGFMTGFPLGGIMLEYLPWQWLFLINLPIGVVGIYLVNRYFRSLPKPELKAALPLGGGIAIAVALVGFTYGLTLIHDHAFGSIEVLASFAISLVGFYFFFRFESRPETALIGLNIFRKPLFTFSVLAAMTHFVASSGSLVLLPFYFEHVRGYSPKEVGLHMFILPIMMFIFAPLTGRLADKMGFRFFTVLGAVLGIVALAMMVNFTPVATELYIILTLILFGASAGIFSTPNSSTMMGSVEPKERAIASGILATNRNIGMSIGVAVATSVYAYYGHRFAGTMDSEWLFIFSYRPVLYVSVLFGVLSLIFCLLRPDTTKARKEGSKSREASRQH